MSFDPLVNQEIEINGTTYHFAGNPTAPSIPYGQEGRAATVYKLDSAQESLAIKVFKPRFCTPNLASLANRLAPFASQPGLTVCRRTVLTPQRHAALLRQFQDLMYAVLMPWIEGPTWMQVLQDQIPLTRQQSLMLAQSLAQILSEMEQQGIAHGDLSGPNLILPVLSESGQSKSYAPIELVDVEQMYAKSLDRPEILPSGSEGYAHKTVRQEKIWDDRVDRFAGAIILAEMLGWSDEGIRKAAWGESYFDPQELQRPSKRFTLLRDHLRDCWDDGIVKLLDRAWNSDVLADCPTFGSWLIALPETVPQPEKAGVYYPPQSDPERQDMHSPASGENPEIAMMIEAGGQMAAQGNTAGARDAYQKALALASPESANAKAIALLLTSLEKVSTTDSWSSSHTAIIDSAAERAADPEEIYRGRNEAVDVSADVPQYTDAPHKQLWVWLIAALAVIGIIVFTAVAFNGNTGAASQTTAIPTAVAAATAVKNEAIPSQPSVAVYFVSDRDKKREIYRLEGTQSTRVTNTPANFESWDPFFIPSGELYFTSNRSGKQEIYRLEGSATTQVTNSPMKTESWGPFFTQSGDIYFTSNRDGKREIYRISNGQTIRVTNTPVNGESWDPFFTENSSLYFTSNRDGKREIYRLDGSQTTRVTNTPGTGESWNPFFTQQSGVYFTSNRDGKNEIYRLEGSQTVRVTYTPGKGGSWDPFFTENSEIYFTSDRDGKSEVYRLDGDKTTRVTNTSGTHESWSPFFR